MLDVRTSCAGRRHAVAGSGQKVFWQTRSLPEAGGDGLPDVQVKPAGRQFYIFMVVFVLYFWYCSCCIGSLSFPMKEFSNLGAMAYVFSV